MKAASLRDRLRAQLADLKMPGALEALDDILSQLDSGKLPPAQAIEALLGAQIQLRNNRRLVAAMRASRLPAAENLTDFAFTFPPTIKAEQLARLHPPRFINGRQNQILRRPARQGK